MEINDSEKQTLKRALFFYKGTIDFALRNRKVKRSVKDVQKFIDLYEQDLKNIDCINKYLGGLL